ncbi:hypothetical protein B0H17DRAFT_1205203 [Mycena rosella]|uniref:BTB domain-containing protein n=1 Tax=Mycena rosella TaxID=1033263 RepID=A0AAD7GCZ7_MYCRO|nr:hypothetical protein B0H17DRAFT_1205203 [Mycena rosella]
MALFPQRSTRFYNDTEGYQTLQVENTLYKLDAGALARSSEYFKNMFQTPGPTNGVKKTSFDTTPITLIDSVLVSEFDIFVSLAYGRPPRADQWPKGSEANPVLLRLLELSRYFMSQPARELALHVIKTRSFYFPPAQLIHLSYEYQTKVLFATAFQQLASSSLRELKPADIQWMGYPVYVALARLKEAMQQHRSILAAEAPEIDPIRGHSSECENKAACARDWHAAWWNGRFERMEVGEMNPKCRLKMMGIVNGGEGNSHGFDLISGVTEQLMGGIVEVVEEQEVL